MIGSLFSGYGGLDYAVQMVCGGNVAWVSDNDPGASKILAHRYPHVPNLGDVTTVDWSQVEPVDLLTAGFPCQPVSHAGKRKGTADERWLFDEICKALRGLDPPPRLCLFENVAGLLTNNRGDAMARVVHGLAQIGYVGRWRTVRASDIGAPHRRERVFIVAWPGAGHTGHESGGTEQGQQPASTACGAVEPSAGVAHSGSKRLAWSEQDTGSKPAPADDTSRCPVAQPDQLGHERGREAWDGWAGFADIGFAAADTEHNGCNGAQITSGAGAGETDGRLLQLEGHSAADPGRQHGERRSHKITGSISGREAASGSGQPSAATADSERIAGRTTRRTWPKDADIETGQASRAARCDWGDYTVAVARWEHVLRRSSPSPTEPGRNGQPRLSPTFVEWMMGLDAGWVTDVPGLSRNDQLKALGNGVVPQQAALALALLLNGQVAA